MALVRPPALWRVSRLATAGRVVSLRERGDGVGVTRRARKRHATSSTLGNRPRLDIEERTHVI